MFKRALTASLIFVAVAAVSAGCRSHSPVQEIADSIVRDNPALIPTVEYCELVNDPLRYDGREIRLKAYLGWFAHGFFLADMKCAADDIDSVRTALRFPESESRAMINALFERLKTGDQTEPPKIVLVGRYGYKRQIGDSDHIMDRTHLQFEIHKIE